MKNPQKSCFHRFVWHPIKKFTSCLAFKRSKLNKMSSRLDFSAHAYFSILYDIINQFLVASIILIYLIIRIIVGSTDVSIVNGFTAQSFAYIDSMLALDHSISIMLVSLFLFLRFIINYLRKEKHYLRLKYNKSQAISHLVFAQWSWDSRSHREFLEKKLAFMNSTRVEAESNLLLEDDMPDHSRLKVYSLRFCGLVITIGLIIGQWAIALSMHTKNGLTDSINEMKVQLIPEFLIGLLVSIFGSVIGLFARYLTFIEFWRDKNIRNKVYVWKYFLSKAIFAAFNCYMVYMTANVLHGSNSSGALLFDMEPEFAPHRHDCRETHIVYKLLGLVIGELVLSMLFITCKYIVNKIYKKVKDKFATRPPFDVERRLGVAFTMQLYIFAILPFMPLMAFLGLGLFAILFDIQLFLVRRFEAHTYLHISHSTLSKFTKHAQGVTLILFLLLMMYFFAAFRPGYSLN
mmetsp:Transcript_29699/g.27165  ORF Transcript_29699/g.27165 Transcript_29699/m.27165 type:complete len:461 (+) Transcript_29699:885-2267(+)